MRNIYFLFWILLHVNGVSAEKHTVTLLMEDSVTLQSGVSGLPSSDTTRWLFENERIAEISEGTKRPLQLKGSLEKFKERLQLDPKTGSLNITNIRTEHAGEYKLEIRSKTPIIRTFNVTVKDGVKSVSVMEGDSVTLHTGVTQIDHVKWTPEYENLTDDQTGDLTINIMGKRQRGKYVLEINNSEMSLQRTYHVDLIDEKPKVSVKEGKNVFLITGVKDIQLYDLIVKNKGDTIAKIDKNDQSRNNSSNSRLLLDILNGSLIISNSATTDTGDYNLTMSSSTYSLQRTISVTVSSPDSGVATGTEAGIVVGLLVFLWCLQLK